MKFFTVKIYTRCIEQKRYLREAREPGFFSSYASDVQMCTMGVTDTEIGRGHIQDEIQHHAAAAYSCNGIRVQYDHNLDCHGGRSGEGAGGNLRLYRDDGSCCTCIFATDEAETEILTYIPVAILCGLLSRIIVDLWYDIACRKSLQSME